VTTGRDAGGRGGRSKRPPPDLVELPRAESDHEL